MLLCLFHWAKCDIARFYQYFIRCLIVCSHSFVMQKSQVIYKGQIIGLCAVYAKNCIYGDTDYQHWRVYITRHSRTNHCSRQTSTTHAGNNAIEAHMLCSLTIWSGTGWQASIVGRCVIQPTHVGLPQTTISKLQWLMEKQIKTVLSEIIGLTNIVGEWVVVSNDWCPKIYLFKLYSVLTYRDENYDAWMCNRKYQNFRPRSLAKCF
jgi:hypothetical protein